jgi:hypothetical protein
MRSTKLATAIAAAGTLLALAPAGAVAAHVPRLNKAHRHLNPVRCRITANAEPHAVTSGETVQVFGQLSCPSGTAAGQAVTVYERSAGTPGLKAIGTPTTASDGSYAIVSPAVTSNSGFYATAAGARSSTRNVKVAPQVSLSGPAEGAQVKTGIRNHVTFAGSVNPIEDAGAEVQLQREGATSNEEWHTIQRFIAVRSDGSYSFVHTFGAPGDANLRVIVRPHGKFDVRGISNTLSYEISQNQNPRLTINSSADPATYGAPITISGVLAGGANRKVTLLTHTTKTQFAAAQPSTTNGTGEYKFVIPSATSNTHYRVTNGSIKSAVLYEGVKYVLTSGISASTVVSGQPLTFSGTVAPAQVGHGVYLERQNAFGGGYHVVDVTSVVTGGTYTLTHYMFGQGKQVYRIKVPGNPTNQAVSGTPFSIAVTPAPPGTLRPVRQGVLPG